jgi:alcohol dehydrogenase
MKAVKINAYGGIENLELVTDAQEPILKDGQLLVEVKAVSINPIDYKVREGYLKQMAPLQLPSTIGGDFSGIVKKTGNNVTKFNTGDQVYGQAIVLNGGSGSFAEFVAANSNNSALKPQKADYMEAAALPLAGVSALQAIEGKINLKKGQKILIHGGAGGIGSIAIQIAKSIGAFIATTVSEKDKSFVKELGADIIIDYHAQNFENELKDYDAVFDTVGGEITNKSFKVLRNGGILVSMAGQPNEEFAKENKIKAIGQMTSTTTEYLDRLREHVDNGKIKVYVDRTFQLDKVRDAFAYAEHNHPKGKVVVNIC